MACASRGFRAWKRLSPLWSSTLSPLKRPKHKKGRVLANFYRYYCLKLVKHTGFEPKFDQAALKKVAKTWGFCNILSSKCHTFRLKLGVFDDFVTNKRRKTWQRPSFSQFLSILFFESSGKRAGCSQQLSKKLCKKWLKILSSKCHKFRLKLGVFDVFASRKRAKT